MSPLVNGFLVCRHCKKQRIVHDTAGRCPPDGGPATHWDSRDDETVKQMDSGRAFIRGIPQRKEPVKQSDFRHTHEWGETSDGKRVCKGCGVIA